MSMVFEKLLFRQPAVFHAVIDLRGPLISVFEHASLCSARTSTGAQMVALKSSLVWGFRETVDNYRSQLGL